MCMLFMLCGMYLGPHNPSGIMTIVLSSGVLLSAGLQSWLEIRGLMWQRRVLAAPSLGSS